MRAGTGQGGTRGAHKGRATGVASRRWQGGAGGRGAGNATETRKWGAGRVLSLGEERLAAPARGALGCGMGGGAKVGRDGLGRGRWDHVGPTCGGQVDQLDRHLQVRVTCARCRTHLGQRP